MGPRAEAEDVTTIRELAAGLAVGQSRSGLLCPGCGGGRTAERTLSVWRDEVGVGFKCHRASCDVGGVRDAVPGPAQTGPGPFKPRPYPYELTTPARDHEIWDRLGVPLSGRNSGTSTVTGVSAKADDSQEVVWEVRDYEYAARGHISRTYPGKFVRTWKTQPGPFYGFMGWTRKPVLWIVEDMVSAAKIYLGGGNSLALLGTHFSSDGRGELKSYLEKYPETRVRVALDPDAYEVGARLARELTFQLGRAILFIPMRADPKDLEPQELRDLIAGT